jgi:tetratricopeptide (TPR) repeat protein
MAALFASNPSYIEYEKLLHELHQLMAQGKGDSPEADLIRDEMDRPWRELSEEEIARLNGLSADLYMLQGDEVFEPLSEAERTRERLGPALKEANDRRDWQEVLALLRKGPQFLSPDQIAVIRAEAYKELGHLDTALMFIDYAAKFEPHTVLYNWKATEVLLKLGRFHEARVRTDEQLESKDLVPVLLIQSASSMVAAARHSPKEEASSLYQQAIKLLRHVLPDTLPVPGLSPSTIAFGYGLLGHCYELLDQPENALKAYDSALAADPDDPLVLVSRGFLRLEANVPGADSDLERAVARNTPVITPYIYLAHQALTQGRYEQCVELCNRILALTDDPSLQATALQWIAISRSELRDPPELVRQYLVMALSLAPLNEAIQQSLEYFDHVIRSRTRSDDHEFAWQGVESLDLKKTYAKQRDIPSLLGAA